MQVFVLVLMFVTAQYGDCFTFVLVGRKVTANLGPKGNDFVLGGKTSHIAAEDVYGVCIPHLHISYPQILISIAWFCIVSPSQLPCSAKVLFMTSRTRF